MIPSALLEWPGEWLLIVAIAAVLAAWTAVVFVVLGAIAARWRP